MNSSSTVVLQLSEWRGINESLSPSRNKKEDNPSISSSTICQRSPSFRASENVCPHSNLELLRRFAWISRVTPKPSRDPLRSELHHKGDETEQHTWKY